MTKTEFKVGEVFQCGLVKLKCIEHKNNEIYGDCTGCYFDGSICDKTITGRCSKRNREDKKDVIFIIVE